MTPGTAILNIAIRVNLVALICPGPDRNPLSHALLDEWGNRQKSDASILPVLPFAIQIAPRHKQAHSEKLNHVLRLSIDVHGPDLHPTLLTEHTCLLDYFFLILDLLPLKRLVHLSFT